MNPIYLNLSRLFIFLNTFERVWGLCEYQIKCKTAKLQDNNVIAYVSFVTQQKGSKLHKLKQQKSGFYAQLIGYQRIFTKRELLP